LNEGFYRLGATLATATNNMLPKSESIFPIPPEVY
jgi:hypothetical protein